MKVLARMTAERDRLQRDLQDDPRFAQLRELEAAIDVVSRFEPAGKAAAAVNKMRALGAVVGANGNGTADSGISKDSPVADIVMHVIMSNARPMALDEVYQGVKAYRRTTTRPSVEQAINVLVNKRKKLVRGPNRMGIVGLRSMRKQMKAMAQERAAAADSTPSAETAVAAGE